MTNFEQNLLLHYKKMELSDDEALILLITHSLVENGTKFVNPMDLSLLCSFSPTKIDVIYSNLTSKKFIETTMNSDGSVSTSFDELYKKLDAFNVKGNSNLKGAYIEFMQDFFKRVLSPLEHDVIQSWVNKGYSLDLVKAACKIALNSGNKSIRYIDMIIFEENKKINMGPEAYQQSQIETVDISAIDWLDDND